MRHYYLGIVKAACALKIFVRNDDYDESIKGADGVPTSFCAFWVKGQEHRFISFDETRLTNLTHGQGADRKGRTQRTWHYGPTDDRECVGLSHATRSLSLVGGSNGKHEPLPPYGVLTCENQPRGFKWDKGPIALVNGKELKMSGDYNKKGSVNNENAMALLDKSIFPMLQAYGAPTEDSHALLTCDCVGPHMTLEFIEKCCEYFIDIYPRTRNLSQLQQFEDLR